MSLGDGGNGCSCCQTDEESSNTTYPSFLGRYAGSQMGGKALVEKTTYYGSTCVIDPQEDENGKGEQTRETAFIVD